MGITQTVAPAAEPVELGALKEHCRVTTDALDDLLLSLAGAAREFVENACHRQLVTATWKLTRRAFPAGTCPIVLPRPPLAGDVSVEYVDTDGETQTLDAALYQVVAEHPAKIVPAYGQSWPTARWEPESVRVTYTAGTAVANVPARATLAVKMLVAHWLTHDQPTSSESVRPVPLHVERLMHVLKTGDVAGSYELVDF